MTWLSALTMRLLLIDDDEVLLGTLMERLIKQRYAVDIATDGATAKDFLDLFTYDVIILDMLLPDIDGISLCRQLRQQAITCPIMMLTAKDNSQDKVHALDAGADDYMVKPVDFDELCARIRALLRRDAQEASSTLHWGPLSITPDTFDVHYGDHQLHMTPKEYAILELLVRHPSRVFSLNAIIENLWVFEDPPSGDAVRTHIKGMRQKLKAGGAPKDFIETIYGLGYRLKSLNNQTPAPSAAPSIPSESVNSTDIATAIAKTWTAHQDTMQERLTVLDAAVGALNCGQLNPELRQAGQSQAHKLVGALGCFGLADGSRLARELEQLLQEKTSLDPAETTRAVVLIETLKQHLHQANSDFTFSTEQLESPHIIALGQSSEFGPTLVPLGNNAGLNIEIVPDLLQAKNKIQSKTPDGLVIWCPDKEPDSSGTLALLDQLTKAKDKVAVLVVSKMEDFQQRLTWVQQGVDCFLSPDTSPQQIIKTLQQLLQKQRSDFRVMVVDDDIQVLDFLKVTFSPWGIQLFTLEDPTQLLAQLERVQPNVLVLDIDMPKANGLELCQVLRADARWQQLPILFLTVHEDMDRKKNAFKAGADDFIPKSMMVTDLPLRVLSYLQHVQP
ncbi:response regulator [Leptothoe kymatousa]|uniref:Response regulator n=1 Tax=Leptothoe kymatousa TAU-MAC 1615 TaxID=2364775 RepID=A0ABS5Y747_9CYAN|nr:response regulator [Leptothoe kymatousa]MBT9313622.1 response regulator [Leptothoe kymatousa TAU-MAC 1615]